MSNYDYTYLTHFACFACRKAYRQIPTNRVYRRQGRKILFSFERRDVVCPQCGSVMANMGRNFKAPKRDDLDRWAAIELLHRNGIREIPRHMTSREAAEFVHKLEG